MSMTKKLRIHINVSVLWHIGNSLNNKTM